MKVRVDRQRWLRGDLNSFLLRESDKKMCCLGFAALAAGATKDEINGLTSPANIPTILPDLVTKDYDDSDYFDNKIADQLMLVNDTESITNDSEREAKIIELGNEVGIQFEFIN